MFENMTYENILTDMLSRVTSDVDKREGSVIYDAIAPCAYKLAEAYFNLNNFIDLVSSDTAVGEYLDRVVANYGLKRKPATYAIRKVKTSGAIDVGTRWGLNDTTYVITEKISDTEYKAQCEQAGEIGNRYTGTLENIYNVNGVKAELTDIIISGEDEETDDNLRARFYTYLRRPSTSGNAENYRQWALEVPGVGNAKAIPLWNGPGTVKVLVIDSDMAADELLVQPVYDYIESVRPIGAKVTVSCPSQTEINIAAKVNLNAGYSIQTVQDKFVQLLEEYRKGIVFKDSYISYALIGKLLFDTDGVLDYTGLTLNGAVQNVAIGEEEIPVFHVELGVM